jgi:hypothetical protein
MYAFLQGTLVIGGATHIWCPESELLHVTSACMTLWMSCYGLSLGDVHAECPELTTGLPLRSR